MIFDRFFRPYAEYCLRTTLSEDELKNALDQEFSGYFITSIQAVFSKEDVTFCRTWKPLTLCPVLRGRNSMRGDISIQCRKTESSGETVLDITIAPQDAQLFAWLFLILCIAGVIPFIRAGSWLFIIPLVMAGFLFLVLAACRTFAESEIPEIQKAFEKTLRRLEKKYGSPDLDKRCSP
ncbi:MAG: hypothetical protein IKO93_19490 [Lentisphaeria bacterium]|nr:hypothetical protein [Lentisphaeria bacterium]